MLLEEGDATGLERVDRANSLDLAILLQSSWTSSQAAFTAPHASWPVTTMTLTPATFAAYSSDPSGSSFLHIPGETADKEIANALVKHLLDGDACVNAGKDGGLG